jgi:hypothetical protein
VDVVSAVLQRSPRPPVSPTPRAKRLLWAVAMLDVMAAVWMGTTGDWLDHQSRVSAVITLGGNHLLVFWLAVVAFAILAVLAPFTGGFATLNRVQLGALAGAGVISVVALAGVISVVGLVVGVVLLVAILGRALL